VCAFLTIVTTSSRTHLPLISVLFRLLEPVALVTTQSARLFLHVEAKTKETPGVL